MYVAQPAADHRQSTFGLFFQEHSGWGPGGKEGGPPGGQVHTVEARHYDIVTDQRIVFAYDLLLDEDRISVSLATIERKPERAGTRLTVTEHRALLDGAGDA